MTDKTLSRIIATVIAMLLIFQIGSLISSLFGIAWGAVSAVVVAGVSFFSARIAKAGGKTSAWFLLPTVLFTIFPLSFTVWKAAAEDKSWLDRAIEFGPFIIGFVVPVILLLVVFYELRKRTRES
jgi:glucan phosphoethanolaminetransferase (alkaline phosphatase superfamily)